MSMTKKDFIALADVVKSQHPRHLPAFFPPPSHRALDGAWRAGE